MIPLSAAQISKILSAQKISGNREKVTESVTIDSRTASRGDCFFAIIGERLDGHDFACQALSAGASIVVAERPIHTIGTDSADITVIQVKDTTASLQGLASWLRQQLNPTVVGITGSLGKTTTKELTAALLRIRYNVHASPGNLNNQWGLPLSLLGLDESHQVMVAEMAMSQANEISSLATLANPSIGVITNVAPAHMENFVDLAAVAAAKGELAQKLPASGTLIVNADDPRTDAMPKKLAPHVAHVVRFGYDPSAEVRATNLVSIPDGWAFDLHIGSASRNIELRLPGAAGVPNFLAATATAHALNVTIDEIAAEASKLEPLPNRGAIHRSGSITLVDESYNASPMAMNMALEDFATLPTAGRRIAVLGDMLEMGDWTDQVHRDAGGKAAEIKVDLLLAVGTCAALMAEGATGNGMIRERIHAFDTAEEAASWLAPRLQDGDTVLVKGSRAIHLERVAQAVTTTPVGSNGVVEN